MNISAYNYKSMKSSNSLEIIPSSDIKFSKSYWFELKFIASYLRLISIIYDPRANLEIEMQKIIIAVKI